MPLVNFVKEKRQVQVPEGTNLRRAALEAGIPLYPGPNKYVNCRGLGHCGTCSVLITKGMDHASPKGLWERFRLAVSMAYIGREETMRLACRTQIQGDMDIETQPGMNLYGENFFS